MKGTHRQISLLSALVRKQVISADQVETIVSSSLKKNKSIVPYLISDLKIDAMHLAKVLSDGFGYPLVDIHAIDFSQLPENIVSEKLIRKHQALPVFVRGKVLFVALSDPTKIEVLEELEFNTGYRVELVICSDTALHEAIDKFLESVEDSLEISSMDEQELSGIVVDNEEEQKDDEPADGDDAPIVVYINKILLDAIRRGASDLHFEPYETKYRIRFRVDGVLHEVGSPPSTLALRIAARLKVMSKLDIAERRVPQDGRIKLKLSKSKSIDFRVSTLPTLWGEKIVMRILDSSSAMMGIDALGYDPVQKQRYMDALEKPQGMILVTGPTGSGKTVSLYTGLNILNTEQRNISTAEDPVEINLQGINQVQINTRAGLDFSSALRAFLRQDPDIVMVGEIRDLETAEIAIKAAQTGHLVLSTLHTNSAPETLTRLINMGVPSYNIASSVSLVIAQRLGRRLCNHCKEEEVLPKDELLKHDFTEQQLAKPFTMYKAKGCEHCTSGYKGRVGIYEVMPISPPIAEVIMQGGNSLDIAKIANAEGINNLRKSGIEKIIQGVTSLAEINRVTSH